MSFQKIVALAFSFLVFSCQSSSLGMAGTTPPSHQIWDQLVKAHVKPSGMVDYKGFIKDKAKLEQYLKLISENAPDRKIWSKNQQLAYWINAYNAFTVKLIVDNYPTQSIRDLGPKLKIPLIRDVWHYKFFKIGGVESSLDEIEHSILRKEFDEPRIHFAINCASVSCPPLLNEAFMAEKLESQLQKVAVAFINDPTRNKINPEKVQISSIFSWFQGDFTKKGSLIDFLNQYSKVKIKSNAKVSHLDYNWNLNE
ncbi:DUF547 domain-containing protein [Algoriphagus sanaruensis]|uniref:DUF547 domain-containing protein n=1 Tax=Algoriphagus sanaruensis TaxID=1727163 RepID=A0A142ELZ4_9BACT|nr:DUF547 domain-containing protein [Algoriphagus sanaruensis]AMQ56149.1 hypothetical protein AO498_06965 [Algoriphagus sanaruensis]